MHQLTQNKLTQKGRFPWSNAYKKNINMKLINTKFSNSR